MSGVPARICSLQNLEHASISTHYFLLPDRYPVVPDGKQRCRSRCQHRYEAADQETMTAEDYENLSRKEKREMRREVRKDLKKQLKEYRKSRKAGEASDISLGLLVIIAILLPPLAMALYDGISSRFWISLLLTLLFYLPGLIYTLVVILGEN